MGKRHGAAGPTLALAILSLLPAGAAGQAEAQVQRYEDVPYLTGGVSVEEREALAERAGQEGFDLKVVVATEEGIYLSDVMVRVRDAGGTLRLEAVTDGPWLYTRLPAGEYRIEGTRLDHDGSREVRVTLRPEETREVVLAIP